MNIKLVRFVQHVVDFLWVMAGWVLLATAVCAGIEMSFRGPGPDWNVQQGIYQPTGDPAESARRSIFDALPSTGHILWGSSFNENINELDIEGLPSGAITRWSDAITHSGPGSVYMETAPLSSSKTDFRRLCGALNRNRIATIVHVFPVIDWAGSALEDIYLGLEMNFVGMGNDIYIVSSIKISRTAGPVTKLYYLNAAHVYVDTGISIPTFFVSWSDVWSYTYWRYLKLAVDTSGSIPKYAYLDLDGIRYDLSALNPYYVKPATIDRSFIFLDLSLYTNENNAKSLYVDDVNITDSEP
jgi:hypothetical protein